MIQNQTHHPTPTAEYGNYDEIIQQMKQNPLDFDQIDAADDEFSKEKQKERNDATINRQSIIQMEAMEAFEEYVNDEEEKLDPVVSEKVFQVKNLETGEILDIRNSEYLEMLNQQYAQLSSSTRDSRRSNTSQFKDFNKQVKTNNNRLLDLVEDNKFEQIKEFLAQKDCPVDLNMRGLGGNTLLHTAAIEGYREICELLLQKGASIDSKNKMNQTPLHIAAKRNDLKLVELLISCKANVNAQDLDKNTPLHFSSYMGHHEIIQELFKGKPDTTLKNEFGQTAYDMACNLETKKQFELQGVTKGTEQYLKGMIGDSYVGHSRSDHITRLLYQSRKNTE